MYTMYSVDYLTSVGTLGENSDPDACQSTYLPTVHRYFGR